jgi:hypothetical protein
MWRRGSQNPRLKGLSAENGVANAWGTMRSVLLGGRLSYAGILPRVRRRAEPCIHRVGNVEDPKVIGPSNSSLSQPYVLCAGVAVSRGRRR